MPADLADAVEELFVGRVVPELFRVAGRHVSHPERECVTARERRRRQPGPRRGGIVGAPFGRIPALSTPLGCRRPARRRGGASTSATLSAPLGRRSFARREILAATASAAPTASTAT